MTKSKKSGAKRPMSMKEFERSPQDKAADKKALKEINKKRAKGR